MPEQGGQLRRNKHCAFLKVKLSKENSTFEWVHERGRGQIRVTARDIELDIGDRPWIYAKRVLKILSEEEVVDSLQARIEALKKIEEYPAPELISISGGKFWRGNKKGNTDEQPENLIQLDDFEISKYEVTVGQYVDFLNQLNLSAEVIESKNWIRLGKQVVFMENRFDWTNCEESYPIANVSWHGAKAYADWLSDSLNENIGLPSEAQWEYAAGGGQLGLHQGRKKYSYAGSDSAETVAWYFENAIETLHPVGMLKENPLGLYDMSGNLEEWCLDWYSSDYYQELKKEYEDKTVQNPKGPEEGVRFVIRGGSWSSNAEDIRVTDRDSSDPNGCVNYIGFRLCRNSTQ